jgi:hypothetical protein
LIPLQPLKKLFRFIDGRHRLVLPPTKMVSTVSCVTINPSQCDANLASDATVHRPSISRSELQSG